jgi:glycerophosphoryl diester phosphodiesterase
MVELVLQRGMGDRTVFISMDWQALDRMRERHRDLRIGYVVEKVARAPEALDRATGDPLSLLDFRASIVLDDPTLARKAQSNGVDLAAWTVDDPAEATRVLAAGVRRITTNRVAELLAWSATL